MNRKRYVLRDEVFGGTLFDRKLLKHVFLKSNETAKKTEYEHWKADVYNLRTDIPYSPTRIYFEITTGCNLRCCTCFNSSGQKGKNEMGTEDIFKCLDGLRKDHVFDIRFSGGEITTRPNWYEEVKHAMDIGFAVSINTNGVYKRHDEVVDKLSKLKVDQITISIDGNRNHHDKNRGEGTYDKAIQSLRDLKRKGVVLRTNTVLTSLSIHDAREVVEAVGDYVDEMAFFHMRITGRAKEIKDRKVGFRELHEFSKEMEKIEKEFPQIRFYYKEKAIQENSILPNSFGLMVGSPDGLTRLNLLADGSLWAGGYTAYIDSDLKLGNLRDENYSLLNIWRNSAILEKYRRFGRDLVERCLKCSELNVRCPGVNVEMELIRQKDPSTGNPNCIY